MLFYGMFGIAISGHMVSFQNTLRMRVTKGCLEIYFFLNYFFQVCFSKKSCFRKQLFTKPRRNSSILSIKVKTKNEILC